MKKVFLFIHESESIARIISGYTSLAAIAKAGLNTKADFIQKHESVLDAKVAAKIESPDCEIKVHIA